MFKSRECPSGCARRLVNVMPFWGLVIGLCFGLAAQPKSSLSDELPKFFGVYAESAGDLVELVAHPQSSTRYFAIGGADLLKTLPGPTFATGDLSFIIYSKAVTALKATRLSVAKIGRMTLQLHIPYGTKRVESKKNFEPPRWHVLDQGWQVRIAPVAGHSEMIRLVPEDPFPPGAAALQFAGEIYDFRIEGEANDPRDCLVRIINLAGAEYLFCDDKRLTQFR